MSQEDLLIDGLWHAWERGVIVDPQTILSQGYQSGTEITNNAGGASLEEDWGPGAEKGSSWDLLCTKANQTPSGDVH